MGEVGVHLDHELGAAAQRAREPGQVGVTEPGLGGAVQDLDLRVGRGQPVGDLRRFRRESCRRRPGCDERPAPAARAPPRSRGRSPRCSPPRCTWGSRPRPAPASSGSVVGRAAGRCRGPAWTRSCALGMRGAGATRHHGPWGKTQWNAAPDFETRRGSPEPSNALDRRGAGAWRLITVAAGRCRRGPVADRGGRCSLTLLLVGGGAPRPRHGGRAARGGFFASIGGLARRRRRVVDRPRGTGGERRDRPDAGVHAVRSDRGRTAPRDRADVRRRPRAVHAADPGDPRARARAGDVLRGRGPGALLQRLDHRDRRGRRRDRRPHRGARADVEAAGRRRSERSYSSRPARSSATARRSRACSGRRTDCGTRRRSRSCTGTGC